MARIEVIVQPNSKKNEVVLCEDGTIKIKIKEKPVDGRANKELVRFLKRIFKTKIEILRGEKSTKKILEINGLEKEEIIKKLKSLN